MQSFHSKGSYVLSVLFYILAAVTYARITTIERDVLVIGGGSAGTYTAVRLQQLGKTVALVERENRLGGHVNTYVDPITGQTFDYGVIVFSNISVATSYLDYLEVPVTAYEGTGPNAETIYLDSQTGATVSGSYLMNSPAAIAAYVAQLQMYGSLSLATGYQLPDPVPEALLLPWGEWLQQHNLTSIAYQPFFQAAANVLQQLTLYMFKYFGLNAFVTNAIATANRDNQEIYNQAFAKLGSETNVFLNSNITSVVRKQHGVIARAHTPSGAIKIKSRQIVLAIPPLYTNLAPFLDLREDESNLTKQFTNIYVWDGVFTKSGIPGNIGIELVDPSAEGGIPSLPTTLGISQSPINGTHAMWYGSTSAISDVDVQADMRDTFAFAQHHLNSSSAQGSNATLVEFHSHSPYLLTVSADAIREGFYGKLNALQGQHNTWWTGAAWVTENSASIWNFTEYNVLPGLMKTLE